MDKTSKPINTDTPNVNQNSVNDKLNVNHEQIAALHKRIEAQNG